jgi:hypothetical protein
MAIVYGFFIRSAGTKAPVVKSLANRGATRHASGSLADNRYPVEVNERECARDGDRVTARKLA